MRAMTRTLQRVLVVLPLLVAARAQAQRASIMPIDCGVTRATAPAPQLDWQGTIVQWAEWSVSVGPRRIPVRVVLAHFEPKVVQLSLDVARNGNALGPWSVDHASSDVVLALNAGQFTDDGPWGWVVHNGREWQAPGTGPLAGAFIIDSSGTATIVDAAGVQRARAQGAIVEAIQSYPMLLTQQSVPPSALCPGADDINREHRDTRLAIGVRANGTVIVAMTRYDGAGTFGARVPIGPTTPEMAEIMRRLGAERALMLDGGLSAQLLVRTGNDVKKWEGLRTVPLALVARARR